MSQQDRHLTTEQLSAFLDMRVSAQEQTEYQTHLEGCQQCRREQVGLRQTVELLRAMPPVVLPRSFVLPDTFSMVQQESEEAVPVIAIQRVRRNRIITTMRLVSGLAAVVGLFFLLSSVLPFASGTAMNGVSMSVAVPSAQSGSAATTNSQAQQTGGVTPTGDQPMGQGTPTANTQVTAPRTVLGANAEAGRTTKAHDVQASSTTQAQWLPVLPFFNLSTPEGRIGLGLLLLLLGIMGLVLFAQNKRRGKRVLL